MISVYHFILDHRIGGPHVYSRTIANSLRDHVNSYYVTTGKCGDSKLFLFNLRHYSKFLYPVEVVFNTFRIIWIFRPRKSRKNLIFDVHGCANIAPIFAARMLAIPYVWRFHETLSSYRWLTSFGKLFANRDKAEYVVVAKSSIDIFDLKKAVVLPGAIDLDFWHHIKLDMQNPLKKKPLHLVAVGNLNPLKGLDLLLDALVDFNLPWELDIIGAPLTTHKKYTELLYKKSQSLNKFGTTRFLGWQAPEQIRQLLSRADLFVLPSRSEACPIALLEAMAMQCVCIATDVGDITVIIDSPMVGFVVASDNVSALRNAIFRVYDLSPRERSAMGVSARNRISESYSNMQAAKRNLDVYLRLMEDSEGFN